MSNITTVQSSVNRELKQYNKYFKQTLRSKTGILDVLANYIHRRKENNLIPLITVLSAKLFGEITNKTYSTLALIDYLYTATLIHQDVKEISPDKKSLFHIKELWNSKLSVLLGDYFLAKGLLLSVKNKSYNLLDIVSNSVKQITEFELGMLQLTRDLNFDKNIYLRVIENKFPTLFSACTMSGAISANAKVHQIELMKEFGFNFGLAWQLKQDIEALLDYKTEIKINFPLLISLDHSTESERKELENSVSKLLSRSDKEKIYKLICKNGGLTETKLQLDAYRTKALSVLINLENSENKTAMINFVNSKLTF